MSDFERGRSVEGSELGGGALHSTVTSQKRDISVDAREKVLELNGKDEKDKRTYGRTPDGTGE